MNSLPFILNKPDDGNAPAGGTPTANEVVTKARETELSRTIVERDRQLLERDQKITALQMDNEKLKLDLQTVTTASKSAMKAFAETAGSVIDEIDDFLGFGKPKQPPTKSV